MKKKLVTYVLSGIILIAFIYSLSANLQQKRVSQINPELFINSSSHLEKVKEEELEEQVVALLDGEELEKVISGDEHDHDHNHDQDYEITESEVIVVNMKAPDFELQTLAGDSVKLSNYRGKKIFINFWTTWCPPCVKEMPTIQQFFEDHSTQNSSAVLFSVNVTESEYSVESVKKFAKEHGISFPILLDKKGKVSMEYEILTIPTSYIINEEGTIIEQIIGPVTEELLIEKFNR